MKKTILLAIALFSFNAYCQTDKPFIIKHCVDKMTDREYFFADKSLICANAQKTMGFKITPDFKFENNALVNNGLLCRNVNIGTCDEGDKLIFLFSDDTKITITAWNKFNCEGNAYFNLSEDEYLSLSTKNVNSIRFINGRSYDTYTYTLKPSEQDYFIRAYTKNKIVDEDCSK